MCNLSWITFVTVAVIALQLLKIILIIHLFVMLLNGRWGKRCSVTSRPDVMLAVLDQKTDLWLLHCRNFFTALFVVMVRKAACDRPINTCLERNYHRPGIQVYHAINWTELTPRDGVEAALQHENHVGWQIGVTHLLRVVNCFNSIQAGKNMIWTGSCMTVYLILPV